jgi:hypothetical protein
MNNGLEKIHLQEEVVGPCLKNEPGNFVEGMGGRP